MLQAISAVAAVITLGKVLGFARETVLAAKFGATYQSDAFIVGQIIPTMVCSVIASVISAAFLPVYIDVRRNRGPGSADQLAASCISATVLISAAIIFAGEALGRPLTLLVAPGFTGNTLELTTRITRILVPTILTQSISVILTSMLHADDDFTTPALSGLILNIFVIATALMLGRSQGMVPVTVATLAASIAQVSIQAVVLWKRGYRWYPELDCSNADFRRVIRLMVPIVCGAAGSQLPLLANRVLASRLPEGSIAALNYAERLAGFLPGTVGYPVFTVAYPLLAQLAADKDWIGFRKMYRRSINTMSLVLVPASVGLAVLAEPIVQIVFQRGAFDARATLATAQIMRVLAPGVAVVALRDLTNRSFYALQNTVVPVAAGLLGSVASVILSMILVRHHGANGLALACTISGTAGCVIVGGLLERDVGNRLGSAAELRRQSVPTERSFVRIAASAAAMGATVSAVFRILATRIQPSSTGLLMAVTLAVVGTGFLTYACLIYVSGVPEARVLAKRARLIISARMRLVRSDGARDAK